MSGMTSQSRFLAVAAALAVALGLAACGGGSDDNGGSGGGGGGGGSKIALLLPESKTPRYESQDKPHFESQIKAKCPQCQIIYSNADQDASKQQQQVEAAITDGADVIVLDPVDSDSAASSVTAANQQDIPVIAYDRMINNSDLNSYISFDNVKVGQLQASTLAKKLKQEGSPQGPIVMINGAPTDSNAGQFKQGASDTFKQDGVKVAKSYDTPDWSPNEAQDEMEQANTALGANGYAAVYAANDGTAGGVVAALKGAGVDPSTKWITGQDADLDGIQRIVSGDQYMTVYKAIKTEAKDAADLALAAADGDDPPANLINSQQDNGSGSKIPSVLLTPVAVTKGNIADTVVKDGFWTVKQICTSAYQADCKKIGLD